MSEFYAFVDGALRPYESDVRGRLGELVNLDLASVARMHFEVYPENLHQGLPVVLFFLDQEGEEVPIGSGAMVDPDIMDMDAVLPENYEEQWSERLPGCDLYTEAAGRFLRWFSARWDEAGGGVTGLRATIALHDDDRMFDLRNREWIAC